jgi:hypothetical protein
MKQIDDYARQTGECDMILKDLMVYGQLDSLFFTCFYKIFNEKQTLET